MSHYDLWKDAPVYKGDWDQWFGPSTYSCCGQDIIVTQLFWLMGIQKPSYLDIGAHHPTKISNTALLYLRGARGVNVEANPHLMGDFAKYRPDDTNVCIGVSPDGGPMYFYMWDDHSGRNTFSLKASEQMEVITKHLMLETVRLNHIVDKYCGGHFPDFLSMDIEGLDFDVLKSVDLSQSHPKVICVEVAPNDTRNFVCMMDERGYLPVCRTAMDIIFLRREYRDICQIP